MKNIPIFLSPSGKDYLWGGEKLKTDFGKQIEISPLAETWECSVHPDGYSYAENDPYKGKTLKEIIDTHPYFLGDRNDRDSELSILIKFIDAEKDLSVQVHPSDSYAYENENGQNGKTEMWYVLDAKQDSKIVYGFSHDTDRKTIEKALTDGTIMNHLQSVSIKKDDIFFIEPGTVHAIGAGTIIAEIQESSNITYRLFDYNRVDKNGNKRELHIEKALDVLNYKSSSVPKQPMRVLKYKKGYAGEFLSRCKYFEAYRMLINTSDANEVDYKTDMDGFRVLLCIDGKGAITFENEAMPFGKGNCIFIPASCEIKISGNAQFLDIKG